MIASIVAAKGGAKVTLYEKSKKLARKVLASGNGRCNITNRKLSPQNYHSQTPDFVKYALNTFDQNSTIKFFESIGLYIREESEGKLFPQTLQASSVVNFLQLQAQKRGVKILTEEEVRGIQKEEDSFIITSTNSQKRYQKVLIATGLSSMPNLGGGEEGLVLAKSFGHTIATPYPSLVQLKTKEKLFAKANGVKIDAQLALFTDNEFIQTQRGDLMFREYGLSGTAVLKLSQKASYALVQNSKVRLQVDLVPDIKIERLKHMLYNASKRYTHPKEWLYGIFHSKLISPLLTYSHLDRRSTLSRKDINKLAYDAKHIYFTITGTKGAKYAEVMGGGVSCKEIDPTTMESKIVKGLYFSGELIDVVGDLGGYNLQWAWSSGYLAGVSLAKLTR